MRDRVGDTHPRKFRLNVVLYKKVQKVLFPSIKMTVKKLNENLNPILRFDLNFKKRPVSPLSQKLLSKKSPYFLDPMSIKLSSLTYVNAYASSRALP